MALDFIPLWLAGVFLLVGILGVFFKNSIARKFAVIGSPLGLKVETTLYVLGIVGFVAGGLAFVMAIPGMFLGTASVLGGDDAVSIEGAMLDCKFSTLSLDDGNWNSTRTLSSTNNRHYTVFIQNETSSGDRSINGTLDCDSERADIRQGVSASCHIESDSFKSFTSTTDSNTYYISATDTTQSEVDGHTWRQTAYIQDNAVATTSSDQEETKLVFAQDEASQDLGFYVTLPGDTVLNYLRADQDPQDIRIVCDGETQGTITVVKQSDV